ncbi:hypothetical protein LOK49_Contig321G00001 [Camellia lanceoleosa]|nr:hypothetical protein LOK49_Contig321G00001 [Camellia lanceoleosa]
MKKVEFESSRGGGGECNFQTQSPDKTLPHTKWQACIARCSHIITPRNLRPTFKPKNADPPDDTLLILQPYHHNHHHHHHQKKLQMAKHYSSSSSSGCLCPSEAALALSFSSVSPSPPPLLSSSEPPSTLPAIIALASLLFPTISAFLSSPHPNASQSPHFHEV